MIPPGAITMIDAIFAARKAKTRAQEAQRVSNDHQLNAMLPVKALQAEQELHRIEWRVGFVPYIPPRIASFKSKPIPVMSWKQFCDWAANLATEQLLEQVRAMRAARGAK